MTSFLDHYELALADVAAGQRVPIPLFPIGEWKSAKYPSLPLTRDLADELIAGFEAGVLGTEPVLDSSGNHNTSAPAAGWFKKLYVAPTKDGSEMLFGDAELTDLGAQMLNDGLYKYDSIEIGSVVDNATGAQTDNVFRSATLTNTPVLRMLPPVLDAADVMLAEPVEVALSEVTLAVIPEFIKAKMRAKWLKANPDKTEDDVPENMKASEDNGDPADPHNAGSEPASQSAKGEEGHAVALDEGDADAKGSDQMKAVALKLSLAEDADEATILAAVVKLAEERDTEKARADAAVGKLAEQEKAAHDADVASRLDKAVELAEITPGERITLAEKDDAQRDSFLEARKGFKAITLGESGKSEGGGSAYADASVELAEKAKARAAKDAVSIAAAQSLVLSEDSDLADRYRDFRMNPRKEA